MLKNCKESPGLPKCFSACESETESAKGSLSMLGFSVETVKTGGYDFNEFNHSSLDACKTFCIYDVDCTGIEYADPSVPEVGGRCRVWQHREGLEITVELEGFVCLKYSHTISEGNFCSDWSRVHTQEGLEKCQQLPDEDCYVCKTEKPLGRRLVLI